MTTYTLFVLHGCGGEQDLVLRLHTVDACKVPCSQSLDAMSLVNDGNLPAPY